MKQRNPLTRFIPALGALLIWGTAFADPDIEAVIAAAESAAPDHISKNATIVDRDRNVIREGTNGWTCMPNTLPDDNVPMCNDEVWTELLNALMNKSEFKTDRIGISYMLQGDYGSGVSNSDPFHPDHKNADDYVETGPHLMIVAPKALLEGFTDDPSQGGPYVMWKDTPYAHLMVPVAE